MEALKFCHFVLQATLLASIVVSPYLLGFAAEQLNRLGVRVQARTLDRGVIDQVCGCLVSGALPLDELIYARVFLLLLALRARFSDVSFITSLTFSGETIIVTVSQTKTSGRVTDRLALHLIGPRFLTANLGSERGSL